MSNALTELTKLDFEGKEWISELRNKLCQNGSLSVVDIEEAFYKFNSTNIIETISISEGENIRSPFNRSIYRLFDNINIGGLYDNKSIEFSPNMTIVYGKNGTGKTSYYKILKDAFIGNQNIIGNIYNHSTNNPSAKIQFVNKEKHQKYQRKGIITDFPGNDANTINWIAGNQHQSHLKFCDKEILSSSLIRKDAGWSVDRYKFNSYDKLRLAIDSVEAMVVNELTELNNAFESNFDIVLNGLKSDLTDSIKSLLKTNKENKSLLITTLSEISNYSIDPNIAANKAKVTRDSSLSIQELSTEIDLIKAKIILLNDILNYSVENTQIFSLIDDIAIKINRINELKESIDFSEFKRYQLLFDPAINKDSYIDLLRKIAETALVFGYKSYPEEAEKCFYCNQTLVDESKILIKNVHELIETEINREIQDLNQEISQFSLRINIAILKTISNCHYDEIGEIYSLSTKEVLDIQRIQSDVLNKEILHSLKNQVDKLDKGLPDVFEIWNITEFFYYLVSSEKEILIFKLNNSIKKLTGIEKTRIDAKNKLNSIEDVEFCIAQKTLLNSIIDILKTHAKYQFNHSYFQGYKSKISKDKGRVENELIRNDYLTKFDNHLEFFELARRDKIKRPFSNPGGTSKIDGRIVINDNSFEISSILSEGEAKIFSICDWLTELEFDDNEILVFDDPITSLDQANIHKLVEKIIHLSKEYQVIVFTHNFEFYHRLVQQSLGGSPLNRGKCDICASNIELNQCIGFVNQTHKIQKCCSYYQIEYILQPGQVSKEVMFLSLNWEQRIELLRADLLNGDIREADKHLRTTINNFFERFVLNDIKRQVYKNNDLIKEWRDIRNISETDYDALMEVHNKVSGEGTIHEASPEVRTALDVRGYIIEFNKAVRAMNNMRSYNNPSVTSLTPEIII